MTRSLANRDLDIDVLLNDLEPTRSSCYDKRSTVAGAEKQVSAEIRAAAAKARAHEAALTRPLDHQPAARLALVVVALGLMLIVATLTGNFG